MKIRVHRTPEMKAKGAVQRFVSSQADLDRLLRQFHPRNRQRILERLAPHLGFEAEPVPEWLEVERFDRPVSEQPVSEQPGMVETHAIPDPAQPIVEASRPLPGAKPFRGSRAH